MKELEVFASNHFIILFVYKFRYMPSYSNYQYLFYVSYRSILPVAGISIPLFGSQVRINNSSFKTPSFLLTYKTEGVVRVYSKEIGISKTNLLIGGASE